MADFSDDKAHMENVAVFSNKATIKEQAGAWLVRIDQGELSLDEAAQFQEWLGRSSFHREYLEKIARQWDSMAILQDLAELFPLPNNEWHGGEFKQQEQDRSGESLFGRFWLNLRLPVLAGSAFASCVLLVLLFVGQQPGYQEFSTDIGEQASYQLADGSIIALNTNSHASVDYTGDLRVVRLLNGEANFDVAKNPSRPFVVYAGTGMVWAVGTAFNVRFTTDVVDVTVTEGTVKVYAELNPNKPLPQLTTAAADDNDVVIAEREAIVDAGQSVQYGQIIESQESTVPDVLEQKLAWQEGALVFKGESLEQVLLEASRYTDKQLIINDPAIKNIRIGGHYKTDDIEGLLAALSKGFSLDVVHDSENRIHLSKKQL